ncbi:MAG: glycoside hydrolase family 5 protein [Bacteroidota bacterium]|nr:glycoside hydrolase family 5 protein [Bacteroidota bacterium]
MNFKIIVFALFLGIFVATELQAQPVKEHGNLSVEGAQLTGEHGNATVLNGVSYGWHNWWPRFYNKESVKWLATDWKCSVVRAAMGVDPKKGYIDQPVWSKEKVEAVIQGAIENDIYVIIDWHSHTIKLDAAKAFFTEMATKYGKHPHIIYEIFNEPVKDSWPMVKEYSIELIKTIRAIDPDNIILVGNPHWDQDIHLVADDPIQGFSNIMYTVHFYAGTHGKSLRDRSEHALKKGIPIFISESAGMEASGNGPINYTEWQNWIDWCETNKISLISWSVSDKNETCSMLKTTAASEGNWKEEDMKESGIKTRELLRKQAEK